MKDVEELRREKEAKSHQVNRAILSGFSYEDITTTMQEIMEYFQRVKNEENAAAGAPETSHHSEDDLIRVAMAFSESSEHKKAIERLWRSEDRFKSIFVQSPLGIEIYDPNGILIHANKACLEIFGVTDINEVRGFNLFEDPNVSAEVKEKLFHGQTVRCETEFDFKVVKKMKLYRTRKEGICYIDCLITPLEGEGGICSGFLVQIQDVTQRKMAEKNLRESEERYRQLIELSPDAVFVYSEGRIIFVNFATVNLLGLSGPEEIIGITLADFGKRFLHPSYNQVVQKRMQLIKDRVETVPLLEEKYIRKDGQVVNVEVVGSPVKWHGKPAVQVIVRDISDRKILEEELLKADKLDAIGILAGGIAHDFNNILTVISGNASLCKLYYQGDKKAQTLHKLEEIEKAVQQAKRLTQQFLTFAKGGEPVKKAVLIGDLVKEATLFVLSGSNVGYQFSIPQQSPLVEVDEGQISQVINNIIINAIQAMPHGGTIRVKVAYDSCEDTPLALRECPCVTISIEDEGIGIPREYLQKIFDPYFTTKQKGSGLGLATSHSIIKKHGGWIKVDSEPGMGSTFHICLPVSIGKEWEQCEDEKSSFYGKGKILVMDDEGSIREIAAEMLSNLGYEVQLANNGTEAINKFQAAMVSGQPFDVVILDLTVPGGMGGKETIMKLREIEPNIKALVASGYSNNPVIADYSQHGFDGFITKPFELKELSKAVFKVVGKGN